MCQIGMKISEGQRSGWSSEFSAAQKLIKESLGIPHPMNVSEQKQKSNSDGFLCFVKNFIWLIFYFQRSVDRKRKFSLMTSIVLLQQCYENFVQLCLHNFKSVFLLYYDDDKLQWRTLCYFIFHNISGYPSNGLRKSNHLMVKDHD